MTAPSPDDKRAAAAERMHADGWSHDSRTFNPIPIAEAVEEAELGHAPEDLREPPRSVWRERVATLVAISVGGLLGANARYLVSRWATDRWGSAIPWGTLLINVSGSFVLGFYLTLVTERFAGRATTRLFVATGFLGAYTTFSAFSYEAVMLIQHGEPLRAVAYVAVSLLGGLAAAVAGVVTAHAL
jgi:CrcB protein